MKRNVLIIGSGGREHAIAWKVSQSEEAGRVYVAPGNGGTEEFNVPISFADIAGLCEFAKKNDCLTIVGPEAPLERGLVDRMSELGLEVFGPTRKQAKLETSKVFSKNFMRENQIPTARFKVFADPDEAIAYSNSMEGDLVVKADGLASGKGVAVCSNRKEAFNAIRKIMVEKIFGASGDRIVMEEKLRGRELSVMALCDGVDALYFGNAVDHKRLLDGDLGPNTGGMGAFSPVLGFGQEMIDYVMEAIVRPTVKKSGFRGFIYVGLILTEDGPRVLEFNARLGDPEAQVILPRLESNLLRLIVSVCEGSGLSAAQPLKWSMLHSCGVVMCSEGYPEKPKTGMEIRGLKEVESSSVNLAFHAGTSLKDGKLFTSGGRVVCITALGRSLDEAAKTAYESVSKVSWQGEFHRRDIAKGEKEIRLAAE